MEPTPGNQTSEWRATLVALLTIPGLGAALVVFKDALLTRPWPFVALAVVVAVVAIAYGLQRTWLKVEQIRRGGGATVAVLALLLTSGCSPAHSVSAAAAAPLPLLFVSWCYYAVRCSLAKRRLERVRAQHQRHLAELVEAQSTLRGFAWRGLRSGGPRTLAALAALALLFLSAPAHADEPLAPIRAPVVAPQAAPDAVEMPPATVAAPVVPKFADVAACTIAAQPGVIGQCVADPGKVAPLDSRSFWMAFGGSLGTTAISVIGALVTHYLPPEPLR